jgi:hypothetical protein
MHEEEKRSKANIHGGGHSIKSEVAQTRFTDEKKTGNSERISEMQVNCILEGKGTARTGVLKQFPYSCMG